MELIRTAIPGCFELLPPVHRDDRGLFIKTFHHDIFKSYGLETSYAEEFLTVSHAGVIRGLHYQSPPRELTKVVYCVRGRVFDVVVDLRAGSPAYGRHVTFDLSSEKANMVYIPTGCAHGFQALSDDAAMVYKVTDTHSAEHDAGIHWQSVGISWPGENPTVSSRDRHAPVFADFDSPFTFQRGEGE
jgi:dTDP-4-dehydrorhamnose 3,5-epimerase